MDDRHYRRLENMYRGAPINQLYRPTIRVGAGTAEIDIEAAAQLFHAAGTLHGSVYFKMLDDASFFAVSSLVDDVFVLTVSFTTYITRPVSGGTITARGRVVHAAKSLFLAEAVVVDENDAEVARGNGAFLRSKIALTPMIGYSD